MNGEWGQITGRVNAVWLPDGRSMELVEPLTYVDPDGRTWRAEVGDVTDGASIPRLFWAYAGPFEGEHREAAVLHDRQCKLRAVPSPQVHRMFYRVMRCRGVRPRKAWVMWAAVRLFGPRFGTTGVQQMIGMIRGIFGSQKVAVLVAGWIVTLAAKWGLHLSETEVVALLVSLTSLIGAKAYEDGKKLDNNAHPSQAVTQAADAFQKVNGTAKP